MNVESLEETTLFFKDFVLTIGSTLARASKGKQKKNYEAALRKAKSLENELVKARAKIRRLKKKQPPEKRVDAEP